MTEERRLGDIMTGEILASHFIARSTIEGTFANVRYIEYDEVRFVSVLNLFMADFVPDFDGKRFVFSKFDIDYMACQWNCKQIELFATDENTDGVFTEKILDTNADLTHYTSTGESFAIAFSDIITETDFTHDGGFFNWTYTGVESALRIEVNINGIWDSTASATLNIKVNAAIVASFLVGIGGAFHHFTANIMHDTNFIPSDQILITMDWTGSTAYDLEVLTGSYLRVYRNTFEDDYKFRFLYEQT